MRVVKVIISLGLGAVAILSGLYLFWLKPQLEYAEIATAFAAKKFCSCLHVAGLTEDQCRVDFTDDVSMATFIPQDNGAVVEVLDGKITSRATYRSQIGCVLEPDT